LSGLLALFANNLLPVFLIAGCGYVLARVSGLQPRPVSILAFYLFTPCLIFNLLYSNELKTGEIFKMSGFALAGILGIGVLAWIVGQALRVERRLLMAIMLTSMFSNAGNFGLSLNQFAFGEKALAYASLYFVISAVLSYTVGVVVASLGSTGWRQALTGLFKVPVVYAVILGVLFNELGWRLPLPLDRTVGLLGDGAIPVLLVLLGIQLQHSVGSNHTGALWAANGLRLLVSPALAIGLSLAFGLQGPAPGWDPESAMPTAITTTVLARV
jgi:predicted permease